MQKERNIHGLPRSIALDGWWLNSSQDLLQPPNAPGTRGRSMWPGIRKSGPRYGLLLLILVADFLFWGHQTGLSLAVFGGAVFVIATSDVRPYRHLLRSAILLVLGMLPVVNYVQPLSLVFLAASLLGSLIWARLPLGGAGAIVTGAWHLAFRIPVAGLSALILSLSTFRHQSHGAAQSPQGSPLRIFLRNWAFPLGGTLVFGALLLDANPVLASLITFESDLTELVRRGLFWLGAGLLLWPFLDQGAPDLTPIGSPAQGLRLPGLGINANSTLRALWMFNLLVGVQTFLDLSIFIGGADLPKGMTYASYAQRGAYPLLMATILAGAFALAARPFLGEFRALKPLMLLWLGQNIALGLSALLRLDLYIDAYGLTYLRVRALIWMGLVALGLALTAWQVWKSHSNRWLVLRGGVLGIATLYLCSFVNFAAIIAETNLARWPRTDISYVCALGPTAAAVLADNLRRNPELIIPMSRYACELRAPIVQGWRDWGYRNWSVSRYFDEAHRTELVNENTASR